MLFPTISNTIGKSIANSAIEQFNKMIGNVVTDKNLQEALEKKEINNEGYPIDSSGNRTSDTPVLFKADLDRLYQDSIVYNENLKNNQYTLLVDDYSYVNSSISLSDYGIYTGIYGYISAPTIDMQLPIYLGASNYNMSCGAAHLTYTSLPLGGESTNCVIAGHTGYFGRIFFDNIRNLSIGDEVRLTNFWYTINYKVVDTKIYKPNQSKVIFIDTNRDLLTMLTCISDGDGGFNRYCVICERS